MKKMKRFAALLMSACMALSVLPASAAEAQKTPGTSEKVDGTWYYNSENDAKYTFEKMSHPGIGPGGYDGMVDAPDARNQNYAWSAIESGDYIYIGTCYNSTYGIYWRNVFGMMQNQGKSPAEAAKIAEDFVKFMYNDRFDPALQPRGIIVKYNKITNEFSEVYDSSKDAPEGSDLRQTKCSGYRMAFELNGKLYFVALGSPTMFLLEITPDGKGGETFDTAFERTLTKEGMEKQIASGVHGLIVRDDEILMCLAAEESTDPNGPLGVHPEGGLIIASKDARNWRVIADEDDLGPSAYHNYDGLMGGGIWDIIEFNGHLYVTVVTDLSEVVDDLGHRKVNKQGFALFQGDADANGNYTWTQLSGVDRSGKPVSDIPNGFGCDYAMACNMWVFDDHLYFGTYNDPMLDLTAVADRADFSDLYWDLHYGINLYRMDKAGNITLVGGMPNEAFPVAEGNMGVGLGDNANQYVWRMVTHDDKLWLGTYDTSTLTSAFTQLTDGQLVGMSKDEYQKRVKQLVDLVESFLDLTEKNGEILEEIFEGWIPRKIVDAALRLADAATEQDPVPAYMELLEAYGEMKDRLAGIPSTMETSPRYEFFFKALRQFVAQMDQTMDAIAKPVYYFGCNYYMKNAEQGFDLMYTEDGVNFEVVTSDGFNDPNNHGVRTLVSADEGNTLYVGTANPFNGAQLWRVVTGEIPERVPQPRKFLDVKDTDWFKPYVDDVVSKGIMSGIGGDYFGPMGNTTRGMIATILYNMNGRPEGEFEMTFKDVDPDAYYAKPIAWAQTNGVVKGYSKDTFGPNDYVTREQLAVMLYQYAGSPEVELDELKFKDAENVSDFAESAMLWAVENGIMCGTDMNMLMPLSTATRGEAAAIFSNFSNLVESDAV